MFPSRHEQSARHLRHSTLERRYDFHLGEAVRAAIQGSHDKAAGHSGRALLISRELCANAVDPARHQPELAAALCAHAQYGGGAWQVIEMLTESAGHYAALAEADPAVYEVPRIDVLTRIALASDAAGGTQDAISLLREVVGMYLKAPTASADERDLDLARARFHLGHCLLKTGMGEDGLAETEAGLELAADALDRMRPQGAVPGWLVEAPRYLQLAAPDWAAAAARCMALHAEAGRWQQAARAARTAILVSGGLAELGGDTLRDAHEKISARAEEILANAKHPEHAVVFRGDGSVSRGDDPPYPPVSARPGPVAKTAILPGPAVRTVVSRGEDPPYPPVSARPGPVAKTAILPGPAVRTVVSRGEDPPYPPVSGLPGGRLRSDMRNGRRSSRARPVGGPFQSRWCRLVKPSCEGQDWKGSHVFGLRHTFVVGEALA